MQRKPTLFWIPLLVTALLWAFARPATAQDVPPLAATAQRALLEQMIQHTQATQDAYHSAYDLGQIRSWTAYHNATQSLKQAQIHLSASYKAFQLAQPALAQRLSQGIGAIEQHLAAKDHPALLGKEVYHLIRDIYLADPSIVPNILSAYHRTVEQVQARFSTEAAQGDFRVGLIVESPRALYQLFQTPQQNFRIKRIPSMLNTTKMIRVVLRHSKTGDFLSNTDVSLELLDAKTKKQRWSYKMHPIWDGYPAFVLPLALPNNRPFILQVTVSPFPVSRTSQTYNDLRSGAVLQFPATLRNETLVFSAATTPAALAWRGGIDLLNALAAVGGRWQDNGPYRLGFAIAHPQQVFRWKLGNLQPRHLYRPSNGEIIAFLQDKRSGVLMPSQQLNAFVYWQSSYGKYRSSFPLHPTFDRFFGYQGPISLRPMRYDIQVEITPALIAYFHPEIPLNFSVEIKEYSPHMTPYQTVIRKNRR